jgi:hypothetical protein
MEESRGIPPFTQRIRRNTMPNWVTCSISFSTEKPEEMTAFRKKMTQPRPYIKQDPEHQYKSLPYAPENLEYGDHEFSFWNIVSPDESILPEYWGEQPQTGSIAEALQNKTNFWYDWNIRNWGCKWDARVIDGETYWSETEWSLIIDTPWGAPLEFFEALAEAHPEVHMEAVCIEEQGWGVIYETVEGKIVEAEEWDIPCSHAEHEATLGRYGHSCHCEWGEDDPEYMFDDCPKKKEMVSV